MRFGFSVFLPALFLLGSFVLTAINSAFRTLRHQQSAEVLHRLGKWFFYVPVQNVFIPPSSHKILYLACICGAALSRFGFAASCIFFLVHSGVLMDESIWPPVLWLSACVTGALVIGEITPRLLGSRYPASILRALAPVASAFLTAYFPISYIFLRLSLSWWQKAALEESIDSGAQVKERIFEIIHDEQMGTSIDPEHRRLIESAITFRDRIVREVMVPRVDVLAFDAQTPIRHAAAELAKEGYSRAPIYKGSLDQIVGVVLYKEVLRVYMDACEAGDTALLDAPIQKISTAVMFTPETRKISHMLQEFRRRQLHMAIVVDEYGGTEGVVTMEDLLEEIVGEIEDEYDTEEELYHKDASGALVVDARMSILDIQQKLQIAIPQDGEYDTLGGYIFHRAGSIPQKGMVLHHDDFDLEILSSDERRVHKVRISPLGEKDEL
ncbi:MAG: HlyC/CorC family transporter [Chlamydiia bacterium]|nr:HlyC/CorC family transporter [Chlamydiia bacterium]